MTNLLVAGVGNIFLGDDGFGSAVAEMLLADDLPEGVRVIDYGIRGMHLSYDLVDGVDALIMVDAVPPPRGNPDATPGTVVSLKIDPADNGGAQLDAHSLSPLAVFAHVQALGGSLPPTYVIGCVPADVGEGIGLSEAVQAAVPAGADAVRRLVETLVGSTLSTAQRTGD